MSHTKGESRKMLFYEPLFRRIQNGEIIWVSPKEVEYCTPASPLADLNQHEADLDHPHAFYNRGYFLERARRGSLLAGDWDAYNLSFDTLLEYNALLDHINGKERWSNSSFASRLIHYIKLGHILHGYTDQEKFLVDREKQIDDLIKSISKTGVIPAGGRDAKKAQEDDISVNIARDGMLLFNNRGHHRLSIAKVLGIATVPVQIIVVHTEVMGVGPTQSLELVE